MAADERTPLIATNGSGSTDGNGNGTGIINGHGHGASSSSDDEAGVKSAVAKPNPGFFGPANRILLAGFLMAFTLGITQVPIVYVFRLMECQIFYESHPGSLPPDLSPAVQCQRREIDAGMALQFSILGMSTSLSGVFNLFVCGYFIKIMGPRWAFVTQTSLLGLRVSTQIVGVTVGGRTGEIIFQVGQAIGIIGGPRGFTLVLNTAVGEVVAARERTGVFGRLQGAIMLGTAFGYLLGGVLGDVYNIRRPFETAFFLYVACTIYGILFIPTITSTPESDKKQTGRAPSGFFAPLKVIVPHKYRLESGQVIKNYGLVFLASGIFLGVFASGYAPLLLQLYGTSEFHFTTTENGWLMFGISSIRGLFLLFMFPKIISTGRIWLNGRSPEPSPSTRTEGQQGRAIPDHTIPADPADFSFSEAGQEVPQEPIEAPPINDERDEDEDSGTGFDLLFVRWSLVVDSLVTLFAGFSSHGWQVYLAGFLLPFASGSAPAAKGVMTGLCPSYQRQDAISAITLVESASMLFTQGLFGLIFAAFSEMGRPSLTFFVNAGIAAFAFTVLSLTRLPPVNSQRIDDDDSEETGNDNLEQE
ncbi:major facilitator superfamily transporter [Xylariaceae sp. FL0255]|nr:major facilitator superfamily transporter [Xylariaceae sp. FL0255]